MKREERKMIIRLKRFLEIMAFVSGACMLMAGDDFTFFICFVCFSICSTTCWMCAKVLKRYPTRRNLIELHDYNYTFSDYLKDKKCSLWDMAEFCENDPRWIDYFYEEYHNMARGREIQSKEYINKLLAKRRIYEA